MPSKRSSDKPLVKVLTHDLRVRILEILNERVASPNELANELGESLSLVSYHVKVLREYDCIELVKTIPRRGATEHYYRATSKAFLTGQTWSKIPSSLRPGLSSGLVGSIAADAASSLKEDLFDAREDRHASHATLILDETGWKDLTKALDGALKQVEKIQKQAAERLRKSGEKGFSASVGLLGFEIPDQRKPKKSKKQAKSKGKRKK